MRITPSLLFILSVFTFFPSYSQTISEAISKGTVLQILIEEPDEASMPMGFGLKPMDSVYMETRLEDYEIGSGFIYRAENGYDYVLTNAHVVDKGLQEFGQINARYDGRSYALKWIGGDTYYDLAVLAFEEYPPRGARSFSVLSTNLKMGEPVIAIGNIRGDKDGLVYSGIINGLNQRLDGLTGKVGYIANDDRLKYGFSGGPLINYQGEVVGMNTRVRWNEGEGYAIPIQKIKKLTESIIQNNGRVKRAFIGVEFHQNVISSRGLISYEEKRPLIAKILPGSPFQNLLKEGYYVRSVNGNPVENLELLLEELEKITPGSSLTFDVSHDGKSQWNTISAIPGVLGEKEHETIARSYIDNHLKLQAQNSVTELILAGKWTSQELILGRNYQPDSRLISLRLVSSKPTDHANDPRQYRVQSMADLGIMIKLCSLSGEMWIFYLNENKERESLRVNWGEKRRVLYY